MSAIAKPKPMGSEGATYIFDLHGIVNHITNHITNHTQFQSRGYNWKVVDPQCRTIDDIVLWWIMEEYRLQRCVCWEYRNEYMPDHTTQKILNELPQQLCTELWYNTVWIPEAIFSDATASLYSGVLVLNIKG